MPRSLRSLSRDDRGQMLVLFALLIVVLLGFLGLVVDVGRLYVVRQQLRNACDAAVGAGASRLPGAPAEARAQAMKYYCYNAGGTPPAGAIADQQTYTIADTGDKVFLQTPYGDAGDTLSARKIYCKASRTVGSLFMQVLGIPAQTVSTYAVGLIHGSTSYESMLATNWGAASNRSTQPLPIARSDGQRYSVIIHGNNETFGLNDQGQQVGIIATSQNIYVDANNSVGAAMYGNTNFPNYGDGNAKTSDKLLHPDPGAPSGLYFVDPQYYLDQATAAGHVYTGTQKYSPNGKLLHNFETNQAYIFRNQTVNGFYYVNGDIVIDKNVTGTATFAATGRIFTTETKSNLTYADQKYKLLFYAGCDPTLGTPQQYFASDKFDAMNRFIDLNDNHATYTGSMYSPFGFAMIESNSTTIKGSVIADTIGITDYANNLTITYDPNISPPVAPGPLLIQ